MSKLVYLSQGRVTVVDDADYALVMSYCPWYYSNGYALHSSYIGMVNGRPKRRAIRMHWLILPPKDGVEPDHKDGDGLNNQRANLRYATREQQMANRKPWTTRKGKHSRYKGVSKWGRRWRALINVDKKRTHLGMFSTQEEAARAYNEAAKRLLGEYAWLNDV